MKNIRTKDTGCELAVRKIIYAMGYRYRLHKKSLPGNPDIVFNRRKKVIFVNGCLWHGCKKCNHSKLPESNKSFWVKKIEGNINRDKRNYSKLKRLGWDYLCIWQCEIKKKNEEKLKYRIKKYLEE
ncbi:MAG: very short patch repair endonuclease [Candidatus Omnitrophica bacterium]|nr:very short patch repair endonuclease [Candidatus Omnitrophota bacterium]